jgi:hypothetical protein
VAAVAGEPVVAQDYLFLRVGVAGRATGLHYDYPFFARAHDRVWTVWLPLGDVPMERGPLVMVEGSHRFRDPGRADDRLRRDQGPEPEGGPRLGRGELSRASAEPAC